MEADPAPRERPPGSTDDGEPDPSDAPSTRDQQLRQEAAAVAAFEQAQRPTRAGGMTLEESLERWAAEVGELSHDEKRRVEQWVRDFVVRNDAGYAAGRIKPGMTREELEARWAAARQAPPEEIRRADEWARAVIDSLREDSDPPRRD